MNFERLETQIMHDEGFRARPYLDTVGAPTIGYGTTRLIGRPVQLDDAAITAHDARRLLRADIYGAILDAVAVFDRFDEMDDLRQEVLVNLAYNVGRRGLYGFKRLIGEAYLLRYDRMAAEMQDSKWYNQVGRRGERMVRQMLTGEP